MNHSQDSTPRPLLQIVISMDERLGVHLKHNCPSGDVVEMLLYRALKYAERELTAGRLFKVEEPRVSIEQSLPKDLGSRDG